MELRAKFEEKLDSLINERYKENMNRRPYKYAANGNDHIYSPSFSDYIYGLFNEKWLVFELFKYYDLPMTHCILPYYRREPMSERNEWGYKREERLYWGNKSSPKILSLNSIHEFDAILNILYRLRFSKLFDNPIYTDRILLRKVQVHHRIDNQTVNVGIDDIFYNIEQSKRLNESKIEKRLKECTVDKLIFMFDRD